MQKKSKKITKWVVIAFFVFGGLGLIVWYIATRPPIPESEIVSRKGLHWHANLSIYVKGVQQDIPTDIGIGAVHKPIHTHDANGTLHMEFAGLARKKNITLDQFFKNWGKDFRSFGDKITMTVNDKENTELENYIMKDNDKIEIRYE